MSMNLQMQLGNRSDPRQRESETCNFSHERRQTQNSLRPEGKREDVAKERERNKGTRLKLGKTKKETERRTVENATECLCEC